MATIVPATIAAVVSLLVAFLGHWQWRRQQAAAAADRYHAERADALKELWNKLNDHSTAARIARLDSEQFYRNIQDLNFFLIRRSPFLTESEKDLAHLYLESIYAFRIKVDKSRDKAASQALETTEGPRRVGEIMGAVAAGKMVQELEDRLASHIKDALEGKVRNVDVDVVRLRSELVNEQVLVPEELTSTSQAAKSEHAAADGSRSPDPQTHEQKMLPDIDTPGR
jgi:hypothetical protein